MTPRINEELDRALDEHHGFLQAEGSKGKVVVMSQQVYREMMGVGSDEEMAESLRAIERGIADLDAGRTMSLEEAERRLNQKHGLQH